MMTVHAVTIHHRGRDLLDVCLSTLLASSGVDLEVVIVLNGCDEELPEIVRESPRVHVVEAASPVGFSEANNLGVSFARGRLGEPDYWYFINNDTRSEPDALGLLVAALEADERAAIAGPTLLIEWARDHLNSLGLNVTDDAWGWDEGIGVALADYGPLPGRRPVIAVTGSAILVDAGVYRRLGGWTVLYDYYFEDIDLCLKVRSAGYDVLHEPAAVVGHHVSATMTLESDHKLYLFWRNRLLLAMVHWPRKLLLRVLRIAVVDEVLRRPRVETVVCRRALAGALKKAPDALRARWRRQGTASWVGLLAPRGSVPVITLPEKPSGSAGNGREEPAEVFSAARQVAASPGGGRRVLVLGCSPLPFENQRMNYAPGSRTWQFAEALADDGHSVCVIAMRIPGAYAEETGRIEESEHRGVLAYTVPFDRFREPGLVDEAVDAFDPEVLVGASSSVPVLRAVEIAQDRPVWVDLFGDLMAESQARLGVDPDLELAPFQDLLVRLLERGDAFSVVSERQRFAVLGQLGLIGRLDQQTYGPSVVHTIPCSVPNRQPSWGEGVASLDGPSDLEVGDFVVLWGGGFNTWCDAETLVAGVTRAMSADPKIRLVVTGGPIAGHDETTFRTFVAAVEESGFGDRILIKGQLDAADAAVYRRRADLGVITEKDIVERQLGSSGRVLEWLGAAVPVVCTEISELGATLAARDLVVTYRPGDPDDLARVILEASSDPVSACSRASRAQRFAREVWSVSATTEPLRKWVANGSRSTDHAMRVPAPMLPTHAGLRQFAELRRELAVERANYHRVRSELGSIHQSRMWRFWMLYLKLTGFMRRRSGIVQKPDHEETVG
jgi:GT2 family glycosyltransferase